MLPGETLGGCEPTGATGVAAGPIAPAAEALARGGVGLTAALAAGLVKSGRFGTAGFVPGDTVVGVLGARGATGAGPGVAGEPGWFGVAGTAGVGDVVGVVGVVAAGAAGRGAAGVPPGDAPAGRGAAPGAVCAIAAPLPRTAAATSSAATRRRWGRWCASGREEVSFMQRGGNRHARGTAIAIEWRPTDFNETEGIFVDKSSDVLKSAASRAVPGQAGFDTLIVGAGFAGSVLAERLANVLGQRVLIVDKRPHIGGNAYDRHDDHGVLIHPYGPHIFHTNSADIFEYLSRFTEWRPYQHRVLASVDGQEVPMPINLDTVNKLYGLNLTSFEMEKWFESVAEKKDRILTSEDVVVSKIGRDLYNKFFRGYTRKQWALDPSELDASVTARVPTRTNRDDRYFADTFQAMPKNGYTRMFEKMLSHPNIKVMLNTDYREVADLLPWKHMVYTGPIDAFFNYRHGKLPYRSLEFRHVTHHQEQFQAVGTVNYPNDYAYTRISEFKHITGQQHASTSIVYEYPCADGDPYYPVPRPENAALYKLYEAEAEQMDNVTFVGRLATYKYYNMDQVVGQALTAFKRIEKAALAGTSQPVIKGPTSVTVSERALL